MRSTSETRLFFERLQRSILASQDESANLSARPLLMGSTALVGDNLRQASNLIDAMRRCADTYNLLHGGYYNRVELTPGAIVYRIDTADFPFRGDDNIEARIALMEGVLVFLHTLLSRWAGCDLNRYLIAIHSMRADFDQAGGPRPLSLLPAPARYAAGVYALEYRRSAQDLQRAEWCPSLASIDIYDAVIAQIDGDAKPGIIDRENDFASRVLAMLLSGANDQTHIAKRLAVSAATMRRRLSSEGTNFRSIRASALDTRSKQMLRSGQDIETVATTLGFSDARSFSRAFKAWNGETPANYSHRKLRMTDPA